MTEKELLALAAKAAGYKSAPDVDGMQFVVFEDGVWPVEWNPLNSDGDALRLAVKLRLRVCCPTTDTDIALASVGDVTAYSQDPPTDAPIMSDLYAATRLAITRAAAEIGQTK